MRKLVIFLYFIFLFKIAFAQSFPSLPKFSGFGEVEPAAGNNQTAEVPALEDPNNNSLPDDFDLPVSDNSEDASKKEDSATTSIGTPEVTTAENKETTQKDEGFEVPALPVMGEAGPSVSQDTPEIAEIPKLPDQNTDAKGSNDDALEKELTDDSVRGQFPATPELDFNEKKTEKQKAAETHEIPQTSEDREKEVENLLDQVFDKEKTVEQIAKENADKEAEAELAEKERATRQNDSMKIETLIDVADKPVQPIDNLKTDDSEQVDLSELPSMPASMKDDKSSPFAATGPVSNNSYTYNEQQLSDLLVKAAMRGDKQSVIQLINSGRNVNAQNSYGESALMGAVYNGHNDVVEVLLSAGADVNTVDNKGNSSILVAAAKNNLTAVQQLIRNGAEVDLANNSSDTPLLVATLNSNVGVIDQLVRQGADINKPNADGLTALHIASYNGNAPLVKYLISVGANPNLIARGGLKPYDLAKQKNPALAQMLASHASKNNVSKIPQPVTPQSTADKYAMFPKTFTAPVKAEEPLPQNDWWAAKQKQNQSTPVQSAENDHLQKADYSSFADQYTTKPASLEFAERRAQQQSQQTSMSQPVQAPAPIVMIDASAPVAVPAASEKKWTKLTVDQKTLQQQADEAAAVKQMEIARVRVLQTQPVQPVVPAPAQTWAQIEPVQPVQPSYNNYAAVQNHNVQQPANNNIIQPAEIQQPAPAAETLVKARYDNNGNIINTVAVNNAPAATNNFVAPVIPADNNVFAVPASMNRTKINEVQSNSPAVNNFVPVQPQAIQSQPVPVQQVQQRVIPQPAPFYNQPISNNINVSIPRYADLDPVKQAVWDRKLEEWVMNGINIQTKDDSQKIFWMKQQIVLEKVYQERFSSKVEDIKRKFGGAALNVVPAAKKFSQKQYQPRPRLVEPDLDLLKTSFLEPGLSDSASSY